MTLLGILLLAQSWTVTLEEPSGLYRRIEETVRVPLSKLGGHRAGFTVAGPDGRERPWQVAGDALLFPASVVPGDRPEYRVWCCATNAAPPKFANEILLRRLGTNRVELGNSRFRIVIDLAAAAIVEAYSLAAGPQRMLNLVETSPESSAALKDDIHGTGQRSAPAVPGVDGENAGWTTSGGSGPMTSVELLEQGPLEGRLRLGRKGENWEFVWTAGSPALRWRARGEYRFLSVSASPYLPFDRCVDGSEYRWPTGPGEEEPTPHDVAPREWAEPPGGHFVYYTYAEDYGSLGVVALDSALRWRGACSRRFAARAEGETELALTFPRWRERETVLEARKENRILRQPLLTQVSAAGEAAAPRLAAAAREPESVVRAGSPTPFRPDALPLDGAWELAFAEKGAGPPESGWRTVQVPGSVHLQWLPREKIYTREAEWISGKEWWYRRTFDAPAAYAGKRLRLEFEATDYYADVYVNGRYAGRHEGYIDPWALDVAPLIKPGAQNEIRVRVWTPVHYYWKHRPYTVKGSYGAVDQKPDDITALGITRSVRLAAYAGGVIRDVAVDTRLTGERSATVEVAAETDAPDALWEITLRPRTFSSPVSYQVRAAGSRFTIPVPDARLWWTRDHGRPDLYTLDVRLLDSSGAAIDGRTMAVGIREIEKNGWRFSLNRKPLFIRGTNYYYNLFMSDMTRGRYERDMKLMLGMNVNAIRLHCHFSNPEFYDLADEIGVLVWQDFLEAWYPHDTAFSLRAAALYDAHIRYARNHPSVMAWATSDEEDLENYRDLTKHLEPRASWLDPQRRPVIRSTGRYGDAHVYYGWYGGSIWEYAAMEYDFVTELGATALPNYETLVKFMGGKWPIRDHRDEWSWRRLQIPEAMRAWGDPGDLTMKEYVPRTQMYVARLFQIALERVRRRKAEGAGGIFHFHAIDIWPSVTMAAIDFERTPTKVWDVVRRSFEPVAALFEYDRDRYERGSAFRCGIWAVNDKWDAVPGATVAWRIVDPAGRTAAQGAWPINLAPDSSLKLGDVQWTPSVAGPHKLIAEVRGVSENIFEFEVTEK